MVANRQDAWTKEEDTYLAEVVLKTINEGETQLAAFKIVAKELSRTPAACGYRWNSFVRKFYKEDIENAKNSSKKLEKGKKVETIHTIQKNEQVNTAYEEEITFNAVYDFLKNLEKKVDIQQSIKEIHTLEKQLLKIKQENEYLKKEKQQLQEKVIELEQEYEHFFDYLDKKRKSVGVVNGKNEQKS
ncbi:RsfA family transcriptional regulator [Bacillus sp. RG28]|uniref:RsfA family transcriptional regulator n=1 Tax=Gottfriedia endophytica TaxID=2820819 RepID=A0A940SG84_9BACI|nr:RsfA family transcriptional regulator [Gottfriedia endophytica]MBP0724802.1 RsfA family transcriptional regulator [Gottfriedia endophytica]